VAAAAGEESGGGGGGTTHALSARTNEGRKEGSVRVGVEVIMIMRMSSREEAEFHCAHHG
jgi:hypothetical protein